MSQNTVRRVAIIGGNRIPFARSNTAYFKASNSDMLTAALNGLVERFNLQGKRIGEVVAGAVLKHSRDFNMTREVVLSTDLAPETLLMTFKLLVVQVYKQLLLLQTKLHLVKSM